MADRAGEATTIKAMPTAGQHRLRELLERSDREPGALRDAALKDGVIRGDARTGQHLGPTSSSATYARFQAAAFVDRVDRVDNHDVDVDTIAYARPDAGHELFECPAVSGAIKWQSTYWALAELSAGRRLPTRGAGATILLGSSILCEADSEHRALAAFLFAGRLSTEGGRIRLVHDEPDTELRDACRRLDRHAQAIDGFYLRVRDYGEDRARLLDMAARVQAAANLSPQLRVRTLDELDAATAKPPPAIEAPGRSRFRWRRRT